MKKVRIIILFMTLFLGMYFLMPAKVFASEWVTPSEWYNHISQFDYGFAKGEVDILGEITIVEEPAHEYDGGWIYYSYYDYYEGSPYFEPELIDLGLDVLIMEGDGILWYLEEHYGDDFDGYFYWNFEQKYWQVEYYETSEVDYYIQRIDELENEIQDLENEIGLLEDEIQDLENEISLLENEIQDLEDEIQDLENEISLLEDEIQDLENEIQQLEEALDFEYERGFDEGYEIGYNEGLLVENNNDITKWFVPLVVIIIVVGILEPILLFKRRG